VERLRHPEYDTVVAALNAQRQDTLDELDIEMELHFDCGMSVRRAYRRFLRLCRAGW